MGSWEHSVRAIWWQAADRLGLGFVPTRQVLRLTSVFQSGMKPRRTRPPYHHLGLFPCWESQTDSDSRSAAFHVVFQTEAGSDHGWLHPCIYTPARLLACIYPTPRSNQVDRQTRIRSPTMCHAGYKRPRAEMTTTRLALYNDPSAADKQQTIEDAGALVPFVPPRDEPIDAVPLRAVAPNPKKTKLAPDSVVRAEPPWLRRGLLQHLEFRWDLPVYFIDEKAVTATDLVPHQNRFRLPSEGVARNLWPLLSPLDRNAANMLHEDAPREPRPPKLPPRAPGEKATKRKGKKHGGLPVLVVEPHAGVRELQLARWDSSGGTVIKGEGYLDFIRSCGFKVDDVVEIWAFKERNFHLFGTDWLHESPLYLLIAKKGELMLPR